MFSSRSSSRRRREESCKQGVECLLRLIRNMRVGGNNLVKEPLPENRRAGSFSEVTAWRGIGAGWTQLHGDFHDLGFSFEWHDFKSEQPLDWSKSFHPGSVEICLNLSGSGHVSCGKEKVQYESLTSGFYCKGGNDIEAVRDANDEHRFITVEFSPRFLRQQLNGREKFLHPLVKEVVAGSSSSGATTATRLNQRQQDLVAQLREPPVMRAAQSIWYQSRAFDLMVEFFFRTPEEELFCSRQQRLARERVNRVTEILKSNLAEPPSLEELGRKVGCSHFYLSRTFSKEMGITIPQYIRQIRMEKAAELLRKGKLNVTEVAMEVGYASPGHFSTAFHETYGCCPGLFPLSYHANR